MQPVRIPPQFYIVHLVMMLAPAVFTAVVYILIQSGNAATVPDQGMVVFQWVAAGMAVIAAGFSQLVPRFLLRQEKNIPLRKYFTMKIVQWAMLEAAALFFAVMFFLSHQMNLLLPVGVLIALIALLRPTSDELERYKVTDSQWR